MKEKKKLQPEHKALANPHQMNLFCNGKGALANLDEIVEKYNYDYRARELYWDNHFRGQILMMATHYESTRDHAWAAKNDELFRCNGAAMDISVSGLAQANRNRPIGPVAEVLDQLLYVVKNMPHIRLRQLDKQTWRGIVGLLDQTNLFDATVFPLPPKVEKWASGNQEGSAALKLQLRMDGGDGFFRKIMFTPGTGNDSPYFADMLGDLDQQTDQYFIFDGGYWKIDKFYEIVESGNHFVTKRGGNIKPRIVKELPLPQKKLKSGYEVLQDAIVHMGEREDLTFRMLRVRQTEGQEITLLSNLLDFSADRICLLYRYRWSIEIVFRYLKQILQLDHFMSNDPKGITRQIFMALITWCLLIIFNQKDKEKFSPKENWREMYAQFHQAIYNEGYQKGLSDAQAQHQALPQPAPYRIPIGFNATQVQQ